MTPVNAEGEADVWVPVREEGYMCSTCMHIEACMTNAKQGYVDFRNRWNDPIEVMSIAEHQALIYARNRAGEEEARAWTWPHENPPGAWDAVTDRDTRTHKLTADRRFGDAFVEYIHGQGRTLPEFKYGFPVGEELVSAVLQNPHDDAARWAYARWLRTHDSDTARSSADFVEWQLRLAESFRANPRADIRSQLPEAVFSSRQQDHTYLPDLPWWRYPGPSCSSDYETKSGLGHSTTVLTAEGLIDDERYYRGFIEHVAIKASRFLEIADELYSLAPIRQLTITYCKGLDHQDTGLLAALLDSPHLDRIRALKLPVRKFGWDKGDYTELNRLTDADVELLASSKHLGKLRWLDLEDQHRLTIRAFNALAASPNLPELSAVRHDIHRYWYPGAFSFGNLGKQLRELADRPLDRYAAELEARHGRIPWLHVAENYGSDAPDVEAVVEHPVSSNGSTT